MPWETICMVGYLAVATVPLVLTDARSHRLPNVWVIPGILIAITAVTINGVTRQQWPWPAIICGVGYALLCLLLHVSGGMGMGDVKLALALGLAAGMLGWQAGLTAVILAFLSGGALSLAVLAAQHFHRVRQAAYQASNAPGFASMSRRIAFGPFMLLGFWCAVFAALV